MSTRLRLFIIILTLISLIAGGTVVFYHLEPFTWIQAFYFTVTTMTTVGYGDLVPTNDLTRLVVSIYVLVSVSLYVSLITYIGASYLELHERRHKNREK